MAQRAHAQSDYEAVRSDWVWHNVMPLLGYLTLVVAGRMVPHHERPAAFVIAGASLGLMFVAIHNAWDTITYIVINAGGPAEARAEAFAEPVDPEPGVG